MSKFIISIAAVLMAGLPAQAGYCWYQTEYYVPYGCEAVGRTPAGKILLICCN